MPRSTDNSQSFNNWEGRTTKSSIELAVSRKKYRSGSKVLLRSKRDRSWWCGSAEKRDGLSPRAVGSGVCRLQKLQTLENGRYPPVICTTGKWWRAECRGRRKLQPHTPLHMLSTRPMSETASHSVAPAGIRQSSDWRPARKGGLCR